MKLGDAGRQVQVLQELLNGAGYRPSLIPDGQFGPKTRAAVVWYQARWRDPDGEAGPATMLLLAHDVELAPGQSTPPPSIPPGQSLGRAGLQAIRVGYEMKDLPVTEVPLGSNRGPVVDEIEAYYGLRGQPWCAMFVGLCARRGGLTDLPVKAAQPGVAGWVAWAKQRGIWRPQGGGYAPQKGDLFCIAGVGPGVWAHIGFVAAYHGASGWFESLEGNSADRVRSGDRNRNQVAGFICWE